MEKEAGMPSLQGAGLQAERRKEPRMLCSDLVEVYCLHKSRWRFHCVAVLEDISCGGACLQIDMPIPVGSSVRVKYESVELLAEVRWSFYREIGYFIGLQFNDQTKWSRKLFRPKHMLDPAKFDRE